MFESFASNLKALLSRSAFLLNYDFQISMDKECSHDQYGDIFLKPDKPYFQNLDDFGSFSSGINDLF